MDLSSFDYHLPHELIAQHPPAKRDGARMLVVDRSSGTWQDREFKHLPEYFRADDLLVFNNSRVFPSRLIGTRRGNSGRAEVFLVEKIAERWRALGKPGKKLTPGTMVDIAEGFSVLIEEYLPNGERLVRLLADDEWAAINEHGHIPLPPYIRRPDSLDDAERYQTVFAKERGSVAAPTAGLHFTQRMRDSLAAISAEVTLHVGLGTFQPLQSATIEENHLHYERYFVPADTAAKLKEAQRVVAVGTTSVRTIESFARQGNSGQTNLFIYPGFQFQRVGAMLTNFHLPQSSLLLLVCAFGGTDLMLAAYRHAVEQEYRFFSYGDCMLIL
ncbi:MAG: tRNA preQ1(34) S-adenosylmethionine ribosyltransferase-isomerase QueA [Acidobacteria bacterium]|nr:tRNA preQ1(34) S-adenosylmethionine ribosyltransferase-isomerase QueA [Acidobacteriota bacterium]